MSWELRLFPAHCVALVTVSLHRFLLLLCLSLFFPLVCSGFPPFPSPTQPSVLLGEDPPPYSPLTSPESGSAPVISCRVCQSLISVEGKIHQHVVKCGVCNEATVGWCPEDSVDPGVMLAASFRLLYLCVYTLYILYLNFRVQLEVFMGKHQLTLVSSYTPIRSLRSCN